MPRIPSTLALSGWFGFVLVTVLSPSFAEGGTTGSAAFEGLGGSFVAAVMIATATMLLAALWLLHGGRDRRVSLGENLGALGFLAIGLLAVLAPLLGIDPFRTGETSASFWTLLILAVAALWFDRSMAGEAEEAGRDEDFEAAASVIALSMARQTALYSPAHDARPRNDGVR